MRIFLASGHVRDEPLELHALGDLPASSASMVERHVKDCRHCGREWVKITELIQALRLVAALTRDIA